MRLNRPDIRIAFGPWITVALCLLAGSALAISTLRTGETARDRDVAVRLTRTGPQRLDALDAIPHNHEETEPDTVFSSLVFDAAVVPAQSGPWPSMPDAEGPVAGHHGDPGGSAGLVIRVETSAPLRSALAALPPGRGPPAI